MLERGSDRRIRFQIEIPTVLMRLLGACSRDLNRIPAILMRPAPALSPLPMNPGY